MNSNLWVAGANRGRAVAIWGIGISIGYAVCPHMPQSPIIMAIHLVATSVGHAANSGVLRAYIGTYAALLANHGG